MSLKSETASTKILIQVDPDLLELAEPYLAKRKEEITVLETLLKASDYPSIQSLAHKMKGVAASYGFEELSRLGAELEMEAKASNAAPMSQILGLIRDYLSRVEIQKE